MTLENAYSTLSLAVDLLLGHDSIQKRLKWAGIGPLLILLSTTEAIPADAMSDWKAVQAWFDTGDATAGEGGVAVSASSMTDQEAERIAKKIFRVFRLVERDFVLELLEKGRGLDLIL